MFLLPFHFFPPNGYCFAGSRGEEISEEDPQIDIATVQDMLSSHHYKSFKVSMIHRLRFTTDVQLGKSVCVLDAARKPGALSPAQQAAAFALANKTCAVYLLGWNPDDQT